jgi:ABC-type lipoprotein release transport system permease subunit
MIVKLALRNLYRHPRQTLSVGGLVMVAIALLFVGNSIFDGTEAGIEESFIASFTAHLALRARSELEFSIFGDQTPVIGELFRMPTLAPYPEIRRELETLPGVGSVTSLVSGLALLEYGSYRAPAPLFGVEPDTYLHTMPGITLLSGRFLQRGERGVVLPEARLKRIEAEMKQPLPLGALIQFSVADGISFRIRSAPLLGVIRYPLRNETLDSIVLVDPTTLRELYNYLISSGPGGKAQSVATSSSGATSAPNPSPSGFSVDSLFENPEPDKESSSQGVDRTVIEKEIAEALKAPRPAVDEGAWNFILVRVKDGASVAQVHRGLERLLKEKQWEAEVLTWRQTAGTSALFLYWMRMIFNIGFLVVATASLIILMDSFIMSVLERVPEIGTLRALGAPPSVIRRLFLLETTLLAAGAGLLGVGLGVGVSLFLKAHPFRLENPFLIQLFGGAGLIPRISFPRTVLSWAVAVGMGLLGWIYPVRVALRVEPRQAMERRL